MTLKKIDSNIKRVVTNAAKLNGLIHETAVMIVEHAKAHGDCTRAQFLVNAMPASMRRTMLMLWFHTFTPIVTKADPKWTAKMHKKDTKGYVEWDIPAAKAKPFFELAEENPEKQYDFAALVAMVEKLGKAIEKKVEDGKVPANDVQGALEIAAKVKGLRFVRPAAPAPVEQKEEHFPALKAVNG